MAPSKRLKILCLDGGGFRGLSSLLMLQVVFNMFKFNLKPPQPDLNPCDFFDLMTGTSTGGIIALMLGRLRMSIEECIQVYSKLGQEIFGKKQGFPHEELFEAVRLEEAIRDIVKTKTGDADAPLLDPLAENCCKVAIFTLNEFNVNPSEPEILRTYVSQEIPPDGLGPWTIWQAARATSAAPIFFEPLVRGKPPRTVHYFDAGMGHNNPAYVARSEAERIWGEFGILKWQEDIGLFLSLGTGVPKILQIESEKSIAAQISAKFKKPLDLVSIMKEMMTDTQTIADRMNREFGSLSGPVIYVRLNVEQGLSSLQLFDYEKEEPLRMYTKTYINSNTAELRRCAASMANLFVAEPPVTANRQEADLRTRLERLRTIPDQPAGGG